MQTNQQTAPNVQTAPNLRIVTSENEALLCVKEDLASIMVEELLDYLEQLAAAPEVDLWARATVTALRKTVACLRLRSEDLNEYADQLERFLEATTGEPDRVIEDAASCVVAALHTAADLAPSRTA